MKGLTLLATLLILTGMASASADEPVFHDRNDTGGDINFSSGDYSFDLTVTSRSCTSVERPGGITKGDFITLESYPPQHRAFFNGTVVTPTPCSIMNYSISETDDGLVLNIFPDGRGDDGACVDCVGAVKYDGVFKYTGEEFELEVRHDGQKVGNISVPRQVNYTDPEPPEEPKRNGLLAGIVQWFRNLF